MKKNEIKRNIITLTLTIIMLVSFALPAFAYGANEIIKNFETDNGDIVESYYYPSVKDELSATIKSDSVYVYDYIGDCSYGVEAEGLAGVKVWLCQYIEYANGEVLYRYYLDDYNNDFYYTSVSYQFISAKDVIIDGAEVEETVEPETEEIVIEEEIIPEVEETVPEVEEVVEEETEETVVEKTPALTLDFLPENLIADAETSSAKTATINGTSVKVYKSLDNGAEAIEIAVDANTKIDLITKYTFTKADGSKLVFYRYDYLGSNQALSDAALSEYSGYVFIFADDITVEEPVEEEIVVTPTQNKKTPAAKGKKGAGRR
ncbi:MAG: hypothetical protein IJB44_03695 [Clostridia bacterium]|nr:hypothetical protein [Clostridia bacterium]